MEESLYLTKFARKVHLLHRGEEFRASKIMFDRGMEHPKIEVHTNTEVDEVLGTPRSRACGSATRMGRPSEVPMEGLFMAIGHKPNTDVFRDWLEVDKKGSSRSTTTPGADRRLVHRGRRPRPHVPPGDHRGGQGCMAAIDAERWLEAEAHRGGDGPAW